MRKTLRVIPRAALAAMLAAALLVPNGSAKYVTVGQRPLRITYSGPIVVKAVNPVPTNMIAHGTSGHDAYWRASCNAGVSGQLKLDNFLRFARLDITAGVNDGYYAFILVGGDGGCGAMNFSNDEPQNWVAGGRGGTVYGVYHFTQSESPYYLVAGPAGYQNAHNNGNNGSANASTDNFPRGANLSGGMSSNNERRGGGWGGSCSFIATSQGVPIAIAGGGGGGGGRDQAQMNSAAVCVNSGGHGGNLTDLNGLVNATNRTGWQNTYNTPANFLYYRTPGNRVGIESTGGHSRGCPIGISCHMGGSNDHYTGGIKVADNHEFGTAERGQGGGTNSGGGAGGSTGSPGNGTTWQAANWTLVTGTALTYNGGMGGRAAYDRAAAGGGGGFNGGGGGGSVVTSSNWTSGGGGGGSSFLLDGAYAGFGCVASAVRTNYINPIRDAVNTVTGAGGDFQRIFYSERTCYSYSNVEKTSANVNGNNRFYNGIVVLMYLGPDDGSGIVNTGTANNTASPANYMYNW